MEVWRATLARQVYVAQHREYRDTRKEPLATGISPEQTWGHLALWLLASPLYSDDVRTVFQVPPEPRPLAAARPVESILLHLVDVVVTNDQSHRGAPQMTVRLKPEAMAWVKENGRAGFLRKLTERLYELVQNEEFQDTWEQISPD